jgi:peroxiredoxin
LISKKNILIIALLVGITFFFIAGDVMKSRGRDVDREEENVKVGIDVGQRAPNFTLNDLEGNSVSLEDFKGKVVMINFWSLGCPACLREMPAKDELYLNYQGRGFELITINLDVDILPVKEYFSNSDYSFKVLQGNYDVAMEYMVRFIPKTLIIDQEGIIRFIHVGSLEYQQMVELVEDLL